VHDGRVQFLELAVHRADIDFECREPRLAEIEIHAKLRASIPGTDDIVALHVDGAQVFAVPFGQFEPVKHHGAVIPGVFAFRAHHLRVRVDFVQSRLTVEAEKVRLPGYDPSNGVDIEIMLGDAVATDTVRARGCERDDHHHPRCRPEQGRGHGEHGGTRGSTAR